VLLYRIFSSYQLNAHFLYSITSICYIIILNIFQAVPCSSSGGQIVLLQPLVSSLSVNSRYSMPVDRHTVPAVYREWRYRRL